MNSKVLCRPVHSPSANVSIVPEEKSVLAKMGHAEKYRDTVERNDHPMHFINISTQKDRKIEYIQDTINKNLDLRNN